MVQFLAEKLQNYNFLHNFAPHFAPPKCRENYENFK